jgi:hypothetical protein
LAADLCPLAFEENLVSSPLASCGALLLLAALMFPSLAEAEDPASNAPDAVDTEHIFGFAEGADIGEKGERELEITAYGIAGKSGQYAGVLNETALRYGVADSFRASIGVLTDYHSISGVPGLDDRHTLNVFSGVSSEFRWQFLNRASSPLDLTLSFEPQWQHIDDISGQNQQSYVLPVRILADMALIPEKTFITCNLNYTPTFARSGGNWPLQNPFEIILSASTATPGKGFLGVEIRQSALNQHGFFSGRALFVGPSFFLKLSPAIVIKVAWEAQIPAETGGRTDLVNYERQEIRAQFAWNF